MGHHTHLATGQNTFSKTFGHFVLYIVHKSGLHVALILVVQLDFQHGCSAGLDSDVYCGWFFVCLQSTGPFLHIGAVAAMTALGWIVAGQVVRGERTSECANAADCANEPTHAHIHIHPLSPQLKHVYTQCTLIIYMCVCVCRISGAAAPALCVCSPGSLSDPPHHLLPLHHGAIKPEATAHHYRPPRSSNGD